MFLYVFFLLIVPVNRESTVLNQKEKFIFHTCMLKIIEEIPRELLFTIREDKIEKFV